MIDKTKGTTTGQNVNKTSTPDRSRIDEELGQEGGKMGGKHREKPLGESGENVGSKKKSDKSGCGCP